MADTRPTFDPYHRWLGIPGDQRPPTHYQLLGLVEGESDLEVIEDAAIRQTKHLRAYQTEPHALVCARILGEIAHARQVLTHPQKRQEYDRKLRRDVEARLAAPSPPMPRRSPARSERRAPSSRRRTTFLATAAAVLGLAVIATGIHFHFGRPYPEEESRTEAGPPANPPIESAVARAPDPAPLEELEALNLPPLPPTPEPAEAFEPPSAPIVNPVGVVPAGLVKDPPPATAASSPVVPAVMLEPARKPVKVPPPAPERRRQVEKTVRDSLAKEYAAARNSPADRYLLAEKLYRLGQDSQDDPCARFVLFCEARDLCVQGGRWDLAVEALNALDDEFEIDLLGLRESALQVLSKGSVTREIAHEAVEAAFRSIGDAIEADQPARAAGFLKVAGHLASRAQSLVLATQIKKHEAELRQVLEDHERARVAGEALKKVSDDPAAHLAVGRFLALRKGAWDEGLSHLARAGTGDLPDLARRDLERPQEARKQQELGERWWSLAEKEKDSAWLRAAYLQRADHWYRLALAPPAEPRVNLDAERLRIIAQTPPPLCFTTRDGELRRFVGHTSPVTCLLVTPDGKRLLSGSRDGTVHTWELGTAALRAAFKCSGPLHSLALSPSQRWLAVNGKDTVQVLDAATGKSTAAVLAEPSVPGAFWVEADRLKMIAPTGSYRVLDVVSRFTASADFPVSPSAIEPARDRQHFITLGTTVRLFRGAAGGGWTSLQSFPVPEATCAAFSPDGRWIAIGSVDRKLRLFRTDTVQLPRIFEGLAGTPRCLAMGPGGTRLLSGGEDGVVRLWDVATARVIAQQTFHAAAVHAVGFTPDGKYGLSAGADHVVRMWALPRDRNGGVKLAANVPDAKAPPPLLATPAPGRPTTATATLRQDDPNDPARNAPSRRYAIDLRMGKSYTIDLTSAQFDAFLRLEDAEGTRVAEDDDSGGSTHARLVFRPTADGRYRLVVLPLLPGRFGEFTLRVTEQ